MIELIERRKELKKSIELYQKELNEINNTLRDYARKIQPKEIYGNLQVKSVVGKLFGKEEDTEFLIFSKYLLNEKEKAEHLKEFGAISGDWEKRISSVKYYRKGPVLTHIGGGYIFLEDYVICSDEEWEELRSGNISKFDKGNF